MSIDGVLKEDLNVKSIEEMPFIEKSDVPFFPELGLDRDLMKKSRDENAKDILERSMRFNVRNDIFKYYVIFGENNESFYKEPTFLINHKGFVDEQDGYIETSLKENDGLGFANRFMDTLNRLEYVFIYNKDKKPELSKFDKYFDKYFEKCNRENTYDDYRYIPDFLIKEATLHSRVSAQNHLNKLWPKLKKDIKEEFDNYFKDTTELPKFNLTNTLTAVRLLSEEKFKELNLDLTNINNEITGRIMHRQEDNLLHIYNLLGLSGYFYQAEDGSIKLKDPKQKLKYEAAPLPDRRNF